METDIPEILSDLRIGADAWCGVQEPVAHALTHDDIQDAVAEYLAAGGVITTIPAGVSSNQPVTFNSRITGAATGMEREQQRRVQAKRTAKDIEYCQMLEDLVILDCDRPCHGDKRSHRAAPASHLFLHPRRVRQVEGLRTWEIDAHKRRETMLEVQDAQTSI
ncbi:hypothetical protein JEY63_03705 [Pseudomonas aeruginosa]|nr:hypothetical protein [Pseudomonas aeruginosa]